VPLAVQWHEGVSEFLLAAGGSARWWSGRAL